MATDRDSMQSAGRRAAYTVAAGAAATALGAAAARADVAYSGLQNISVAPGNSQILDLDPDGRDDLQLKNFNFTGGTYFGAFLLRVYGRFVGFEDNDNTTGTGGTPLLLDYASALNRGALIDSSTINENVQQPVLAYPAANPNGQFANVTDKFLGFRFRIGDPFVETTLHFGWVRLDTDLATKKLLIKDWAYQTEPEVGILAGAGGLGDFDIDADVDGNDFLRWQQRTWDDPAAKLAEWRTAYGNGPPATAVTTPVPEPGALGMLAAGASGLLLLRRRRHGFRQ
jgi:hypothetical protein